MQCVNFGVSRVCGSSAPGAVFTSFGIFIFRGCKVMGLFFSSLSPSFAEVFFFFLMVGSGGLSRSSSVATSSLENVYPEGIVIFLRSVIVCFSVMGGDCLTSERMSSILVWCLLVVFSWYMNDSALILG